MVGRAAGGGEGVAMGVGRAGAQVAPLHCRRQAQAVGRCGECVERHTISRRPKSAPVGRRRRQ